MADFAGKTAIVTGASRGIGRAIACALAREGASVVCAARTLEGPPERGSLTQTVADIVAGGGKAFAVACDVTRPDQVAALVRRAESELGRIDLLVNDAGAYTRGKITALTPEEWNNGLAVNLTSAFLLSHYALPGMIERKKGVILNLSSSSAQKYDRRHVAYSTAKAAVDRFTMNLAEEVREDGVIVNAMDPGVVKTEMNRFWEGGDPPEAVLPAVLWLLSREDTSFSGRLVARLEFQKSWP